MPRVNVMDPPGESADELMPSTGRANGPHSWDTGRVSTLVGNGETD
jgi:hypothetical protein